MTAILDIELELITLATARFPDAVVRDELDNRLLEELPTIQITQVPGGSDDGLRLARMLVDVDVYAATRADAVALAREVHHWMTETVRAATTQTAVFSRVRGVTLPATRPYENTSLRRVGATYEVYGYPVS